jgi:uracil-DNA glycosylase family 4
MRPNPKPHSCAGCPAADYGVGFVPPIIPKRQTNLAIVGQGPGEMEARFSEPFFPQAPAGQKLTGWLHQAGLQRTRVLLTNVVWCWLPAAKPKGIPKGNREPTHQEIAHCYRVHLRPCLTRLGFDKPDTFIVPVGAPSTRFFLGLEKGADKYLGTITQRELPTCADDTED